MTHNYILKFGKRLEIRNMITTAGKRIRKMFQKYRHQFP